jgi:hypothetical protein
MFKLLYVKRLVSSIHEGNRERYRFSYMIALLKSVTRRCEETGPVRNVSGLFSRPWRSEKA